MIFLNPVFRVLKGITLTELQKLLAIFWSTHIRLRDLECALSVFIADLSVSFLEMDNAQL